jgi:hypothetical protein
VSQPENRNALIISEFRAKHGRSGAFEGTPLLLRADRTPCAGTA